MECRITRREALGFAALGASVGMAGCEYPRNRELGFSRGTSVKESANGSVEVSVVPMKSATGNDDEWNTFHEVRLIGYSRERDPVCDEQLGTMRRDGTRDAYDSITLRCDAFPVMITYEARESPCDEDTEIEITDYRRIVDGEHSWLKRNRTCEEGLPPPPPEDGWPDPPQRA